MNYIFTILYVTFFTSYVSCFINNPFKSNNFRLKCNKKDKEIKILDIDFESIIDHFDELALNNNLPKVPEYEEEIIDDSFEGYLKSEFYKIADINKKNSKNKVIIDFNKFYLWRRNIGTVLTDQELFDIFMTINENGNCDLMKFILTNKIIDENDGADFS